MRPLPAILSVILILAAAPPGQAQMPPRAAESSLGEATLGSTEFDNSGASDAQAPFLRGLLLLHSFEYAEAREAFQEAQRLDPDFAMAFWGEAMTYNHPVWMRQDTEAGRRALARLPGTARMTDREAAYFRAAHILFGDEATAKEKEVRDDDYARAMRELAAQYPDDLDAQALYALALLGTAHEGRHVPTYMRAAAVAEGVFDANPRHPGAAHYLIHAYDDPRHAPLGLRPARVYADVAPSASHALHMPSHIYLALGMWDDVARMNERSYEAARSGTDARGEPLNGHGWHALWWWHYAALQQGDQAQAAHLLALADSLTDAAPDNPTAKAHQARIRAQHLVHDAASGGAVTMPMWMESIPSVEASLSSSAVITVAAVYALLKAGEQRAAEQLGAAFKKRVVETEQPSWQVRTSSALISGLTAWHAGAIEDGRDHLVEAARIEREAPLTFGPPAPPLMANEALGLLLQSQNEPDAAAEAFQVALDRAPNRRLTSEWTGRSMADLEL